MRWPGKIAMRIGLYVLIAAVVWAIAACALQRRVLFPRHAIPAPPEPSAAETSERIEPWHRDTPAGRVEAWFMPAPDATAAAPKPAVIFAHGNAELIDHNIELANAYHELGVSVLMPEYRGYGRSAGSPSQKAIVADYVAFYDRLAAQPGVDAQRIVFHGRSLGGAVTAQLAEKRRPAAWVLQSTFTSVAAMARGFGVPRFLVRDPFEVKDVLKGYDGPVLILHGTADEIVDISHANALHAAAEGSELATFPTGHNEPMPEDAWRRIEAFLRRSGVMPRQAGE